MNLIKFSHQNSVYNDFPFMLNQACQRWWISLFFSVTVLCSIFVTSVLIFIISFCLHSWHYDFVISLIYEVRCFKFKIAKGALCDKKISELKDNPCRFFQNSEESGKIIKTRKIIKFQNNSRRINTGNWNAIEKKRS